MRLWTLCLTVASRTLILLKEYHHDDGRDDGQDDGRMIISV